MLVTTDNNYKVAGWTEGQDITIVLHIILFCQCIEMDENNVSYYKALSRVDTGLMKKNNLIALKIYLNRCDTIISGINDYKFDISFQFLV